MLFSCIDVISEGLWGLKQQEALSNSSTFKARMLPNVAVFPGKGLSLWAELTARKTRCMQLREEIQAAAAAGIQQDGCLAVMQGPASRTVPGLKAVVCARGRHRQTHTHN